MILLLPKDILLYTIEYIFPKDLYSLRRTNKYLQMNIINLINLDDEKDDITYRTDIISNRERCEVCGSIFSSRFKKDIHQIKRHDDINIGEILKNLQIFPYNTIKPYYLISLYDRDCSTGNCSCLSKKMLHNKFNLPFNIIPIDRTLNKKYTLETNYGFICMDTSFYKKKVLIFTDCIVYEPILDNFWKTPMDFKCPCILQTKNHWWLLLKYSRKLVPIKNIILNK